MRILLICVFCMLLSACGGGTSSNAGGTSVGTTNFSVSGKVLTTQGGPISGVSVVLGGSNTITAITDADGNYTISNASAGNYSLLASVNGYAFSPPFGSVSINNVNITGQNFTGTILQSSTAPTSNPGPNQNVSIGSVVTLDGSASTAQSGRNLTCNWIIISKPASSNATLNNTSLLNPTFIPDVAGNYVIGLSVFDGVVSSSIASVTISALQQPPATLSQKTVKIACGSDHSLAIGTNGTVKSLGRNDYGPLGDGSTVSSGTPVIVSGLSNVVALAGGENHSLALRNDGTVWAWGDNREGQLGNGTTNDHLTPVQVSGISNIASITANWHHSVALRNDGTVWLWGRDYGVSPIQMGGLSNVVSIATGAYFVLALKKDGTVWAWGDNGAGQLGNRTYTKSSSPVQVYSLTNVVGIAAAEDASYAIKSDGTVWSWGYWELVGYPVSGGGNPNAPSQVLGISGVQAIASSNQHVLALGTGGAIGSFWSWGMQNNFGELGDGTFYVDRRAPVIVNGIGNVVAIATGRNHSLALKSDGTIWGWGRADYGEIGLNSTMTNPPNLSKLPILIIGMP